MRLIDADKLKEQFPYYKCLFCRDDIIDTINEAETVYTATKSNGEWITRQKQNSFGQNVVCFECNKCGKYKMPLYHLMITKPLKVCPNCGVEMTGGTE